jgi:hypothetical protein
MKKASHSKKPDIRPEYKREDLGKGVRGKYYRAYSKGTNLVLLSPDVAAAFPTAEAVNETADRGGEAFVLTRDSKGYLILRAHLSQGSRDSGCRRVGAQ